MSDTTNGHDTHYTDPTEPIRRAMIEGQQQVGPLTREQLATVHGDVMDTEELRARYKVMGFMAPFVIVERRLDNKLGTLEFQHEPRFYYGWTPERDDER